MGIWLIDSGASRHFIGYKEVLHNLIEKETNLEIVLGDNMEYPLKGVGNVSLKLNQGNTIHLQDVLYVSDLKKDLVSISAMEDKGYKVTFSDGKVRIWKNNVKDAFTLGFRVDSLYQVKGSPLGVMSCDTSQALVENQNEKKIKILRTDNGTEHESNEFHDFYKEAGIKRETTTPYTPEQNGVVERKNHTIVEAIGAMLHDQRLPKFLWVKAANTIVYVQNRCPHQELGSKTPKEMFTGKKPDISHFRIFGSPVYFHVPKEKMNKLCAFGKKGIFVGYGENTKGYRIYVADQREVVISHDVTFDKDMALSKVDNILTLTSSQESDTRE